MPSVEIVGPASRFFVSQRLRLHYVDWGNEAKPPLLLVHGGRDHARSWDQVARELRHDWHVVAPDLRGHGDSAWAVGSTYALSDFVLDLAQLIEALEVPKVTIVAHSLGGAVSLQYAGAFPEKVAKLVAIEGLGPPPEILERIRDTPGWQRLRSWVEQMQSLAARQLRRYPTIDDAAKRMLEENSFLSEALARHLTIHGVTRNEDGTYTWKFDNYTRGFGPTRFSDEEFLELRRRVACPVLLVRGTESWASDPAADGRADAFPDARVADIEGAGHWVHHDRFEEFVRVVQDFLAEPGGGTVKLEGKVAWVTGGGSGLGLAICERFAAEGAVVAVNDVNAEAAEKTVASLPGSGHIALPGDISDAQAVAQMGATIATSGGRLDVLVNNAGVDRTPGDGMEKMMTTGSLTPHMSDAGWTRMMEIHLNGAFFCAREAVKIMLGQESGVILNMSSIAGLAGMGPIHYATAKAGLLGFTRSLAREVGKNGIRVNAICPGAIDTPMAAAIAEPVMKGLVAATPLGRMGTADEIAGTALFLASEDGAFITGQWLSPNGGIFIG